MHIQVIHYMEASGNKVETYLTIMSVKNNTSHVVKMMAIANNFHFWKKKS